MNDIGNELTNSIPRDGTAPPTNNLPLGGFKITNLGAGTSTTDAATIGSPNFLGVPTAPTAALHTNTTQIATTAGVILELGLYRSARTSNTILAFTDNRSFLDYTGTFTQTLTAAATLTSGWLVYVKNSGSGQITFDPNGSEIIDGDTGAILNPGESWILQCDGTAFYIIRINLGSSNYLKVSEVQTVGTNAAEASMAAATTTTRTLNTVTTNTILGASLSTNAITLSKAGTYFIRAVVPGGVVSASSLVSRHRAYLNNGSTNIIAGSNASAKGDGTVNSPNLTESIITGQFSISSSTTFTIKHAVGTGSATLHGGAPALIGTDSEIYTQVEIWKIA